MLDGGVLRTGWPLRKIIGTVAINMRPVRGPWGGSSTFVKQLSAYLGFRGYRVVFKLDERVDVAILIDPRTETANRVFGVDDIVRVRQRNPRLRVLHRINECDQRKDTSFMDPLLAQANKVADHTVFIARWLLDYHAQRWFDRERPHSVIYNGADPRIFHPVGSLHWDGVSPLKIVTHHWSSHMLKGFREYQQLDTAIANGEIEGVELYIIGRWPDDIQWQAARTIEPLHGAPLARALRQCHLYITASRWEPCGMHHVEGAQCGLPLLYHVDGGGIVEAGERYGVSFSDDLLPRIDEVRSRYPSLRRDVLDNMPSGDRMVHDYATIIQSLITDAAA